MPAAGSSRQKKTKRKAKAKRKARRATPERPPLIVAQPYRRGYKPLPDRSAKIAEKPQVTRLHGVVGTVSRMYELIDLELKKRDWNWSRLAHEIPCSRQYLIDTTNRVSIPVEHFQRVCQVLGLDPEEVIQPSD